MQKRKAIFGLCMLVTGVSLLEISATSRFQLNDYCEKFFECKDMSYECLVETESWMHPVYLTESVDELGTVKRQMLERDLITEDTLLYDDVRSNQDYYNDWIEGMLQEEEEIEDAEEIHEAEETEVLETEQEIVEEQKQPVVSPVSNSVIDDILAKTNAERAACGLSALSLDGNLCKVAQFRASECASITSISHTRPDGSAWYTAMDLYGVNYSFCAENLAWSSVSSEDVVALWMGSEGHRANILSSNVTKIGIGYAQGADGFYFVQSFSN